MESAKAPLRHRLILGKFQVTEVNKGALGVQFKLNLGAGVSAKVDAPIASDVRVGDWLTLYTEVLANADAGPPPIQ